MNLVFFGTPAAAVPALCALAGDRPCLPAGKRHRVVACVTRPDTRAGRGRSVKPPAVKLAAQELSLECLQPPDPNAPEFVERLRALRPDVVCLTNYDFKLGPGLLTLAPLGAVNAHLSLLPRHRGASPVAHSILSGDEATGISIIRMTSRMDAGPVILQLKEPVRPDDTTEVLTARLAELAGGAFMEALDILAENPDAGEPQDESRATFAPKLKREDGLVRWEQPASVIERKTRAYCPWPGMTTFVGKRRLLLVKVHRAEGTGGAAPGDVVSADEKDGFVVACGGDGGEAVELLEVRAAGKRTMTGREFLRGLRGAKILRLG